MTKCWEFDTRATAEHGCSRRLAARKVTVRVGLIRRADATYLSVPVHETAITLRAARRGAGTSAAPCRCAAPGRRRRRSRSSTCCDPRAPAGPYPSPSRRRTGRAASASSALGRASGNRVERPRRTIMPVAAIGRGGGVAGRKLLLRCGDKVLGTHRPGQPTAGARRARPARHTPPDTRPGSRCRSSPRPRGSTRRGLTQQPQRHSGDHA
jgi:hypothetical protein